MNSPVRREVDVAWRGADLLALLVLLTLATGAVAVPALHSRTWFPAEPPLDPQCIAAATERIDPNTASVASLRRLPLIGVVKAEAVVAYRTAHAPNPFRQSEDLAEVHGIGPGLVQRAAPYLIFGPE